MERESGGSGMRERPLAALTRRFPLTSLTDSTERGADSTRTGVLSVGGAVAALQTATIYIEKVDTAIYLNHTITRIQSFSIIKLKLFLTV